MVHQQINFMLEISTHGVIPANTCRDVGGRATQEANAEAGTQSNNVPPKSMPWTPFQGRTNFTEYRISPADFPV